MSEAVAMEAGWQPHYPMARLSSWRAGGCTRWLFSPPSMMELKTMLADGCRLDQLLLVGHGTNLLVRDGGYLGTIVRTAPGLSALRLEEDGSVYAEAGVGCPKLARFCADYGLSGAEFFVGIPGTIGGALAMNAGCHGDETWNRVKAVLTVCNGRYQKQQRDDFAVGYRHVPLSADTFFTAAWFCFDQGNVVKLKENIKTLLRHRRQTQPLGTASAGSVFCNPPGDYAGRLIEYCGLKKTNIGDAEVSAKHANFIVNKGSASANDIEQLILLIQRRVAEKTGIHLRPEVRIIGDSE